MLLSGVTAVSGTPELEQSKRKVKVMAKFLKIDDSGVYIARGRYKGEPLDEVCYEDPELLKALLDSPDPAITDEERELIEKAVSDLI